VQDAGLAFLERAQQEVFWRLNAMIMHRPDSLAKLVRVPAPPRRTVGETHVPSLGISERSEPQRPLRLTARTETVFDPEVVCRVFVWALRLRKLHHKLRAKDSCTSTAALHGSSIQQNLKVGIYLTR
jgi:hypothetical protein